MPPNNVAARTALPSRPSRAKNALAVVEVPLWNAPGVVGKAAAPHAVPAIVGRPAASTAMSRLSSAWLSSPNRVEKASVPLGEKRATKASSSQLPD